jgi:hypothetical protein
MTDPRTTCLRSSLTLSVLSKAAASCFLHFKASDFEGI